MFFSHIFLREHKVLHLGFYVIKRIFAAIIFPQINLFMLNNNMQQYTFFIEALKSPINGEL